MSRPHRPSSARPPSTDSTAWRVASTPPWARSRQGIAGRHPVTQSPVHPQAAERRSDR